MKRLLCTVMILASAVYQETIYKEFDAGSFTVVADDDISGVLFEYNDKGSYVNGSTTISIPTGSSGRVFVYIGYHGVTGQSASSNEVSGSILHCSASIDVPSATKTQHTAIRAGTDGASWGYYIIDPDHNPEITG